MLSEVRASVVSVPRSPVLLYIHFQAPTALIPEPCIRKYNEHASALLGRAEIGCANAGVVFWQFGFEPYVSNKIFGKCRHCEAIQISATDTVFQNVISPAAQQAAKISRGRLPSPKCTPGERRAQILRISFGQR